MALTKAERKKLQSLRNRANKLASDARKLARDTGKELIKQMGKS